jgi:hypothetical protein
MDPAPPEEPPTSGTPARKGVEAIAWAAFFLAFGVRLAWVLAVQSPHGAIYSDMAGYVTRANELLAGQTSGDPRMLAFYPWGTHVILAGLFSLFGKTSLVGIGVVQSLVGAIPAPFCALAVARLVPGRIAAAVCGFGMALWHPHITYSAFFMSEVWFTTAIVLASWLFLRHLEGKRGALGSGLALALAFAIRPQVILTAGVVVLALLPGEVRKLRDRRLRSLRRAWLVRRARRALPGALLAVLPLVITLAGSAVRLHRLSGHWGMISENGPVQKLFADTDVGKIESTWTYDGRSFSAWFSPGSKHPLKPSDVVRFDGYIADPQILERIRLERLRGVTLDVRLRRLYDNAKFLVFKTYPNPEQDFMRDPKRAWLQRNFRLATVNLLPLAACGALVIRRKRAGMIVDANLFTIVFVAAFYYAEARYRVPYDPFLLIAAVCGFATLLRFTGRLIDAARRRRAPA